MVKGNEYCSYSEADRWICVNCGYVHEGSMTDDFKCPICKQPASVFVKVEPVVEKWKCSVCGYVHEGSLAEDFKCPVCKQPASVFEKVE